MFPVVELNLSFLFSFLVRAFSLSPLNKYGLPSTPPFEILDPPLDLQIHPDEVEDDRRRNYTLFFSYKSIVFPAQAEYSYFSADVRLNIFL